VQFPGSRKKIPATDSGSHLSYRAKEQHQSLGFNDSLYVFVK